MCLTLSTFFNSGSAYIVVLQEHWLWPFELGKLQSVSESISYHAVSDPRLSEVSELDRGCGGVGKRASCSEDPLFW